MFFWSYFFRIFTVSQNFHINNFFGGKMIDKSSYLWYNLLTMLQTVSLSSKNQVTIPSVFAKALNLKRGQRLVVELQGNSLVFTPPEELVLRLSGIIQSKKPISNEELERIIEKAKDQNFSTQP